MATGVAPRTHHPFYMYEGIQAQPEAVAECLARHRETAPALAQELSRRARLLLAGIGTSFHAAVVGEYLFRLASSHRVDARAVHSFELVHYGRVSPGDALVVLSHRGTKTFSMQALEAGARQGILCVAVTGRGHGPSMAQAAVVLETVPQEVSAAHTVSYTAALATLALVARETGPSGAPPLEGLERVPDLQRRALGLESRCRELAQAFGEARRFLFVGGGPNTATAWEAALKMKESNYTYAEGLHVEQVLHGPAASMGPDTVLVVLAPPGPSRSRARDVLRAGRTVGAPTILLAEEGDAALGEEADHVLWFPPLPELLSPLVYVLPLQLFAYYGAVVRGANPDTLRTDDPVFDRMRSLYQL